jgi:large subunit ribosomal protein L15
MLKLTNLKSPKGSTRTTKRIGRGPGSGQGCQAGKGHKGQKARAGGGVRLGFEGGNLPLYMRLPKTRKFTDYPFKKDYAVVDLLKIEELFSDGEDVTKAAIIEYRIIKGQKKTLPIKILSKGVVFTKKLRFIDIDSMSEKSKELIEKAGGEILNK